ncbi:FAD-binding oxidoreductase [Microbacterium sp. zg-Y818]|uniref:FAD-binding oxidoreductase n=1 Tax=unclassified Microbacterium TaxID=2609290 RepID=UPI00214BB8AD|nr:MULTISPECIES: FAD-binding oxidoreductase [unclassified Microbacterium]MCR2799709.1 FAD-binding oxidoreductase [Microbacterium sp. zg.Y818]WIM21698.1 FAD-binding oxidoreductase [Microbacterium sp. zg-Y818]
MTLPAPPIDGPAAALRAALAERVVLADDVEYDTARLPWNRSVDRRPLAVARPESAEDVVGIVRAAGSAGLRVMAQSTGHAAGALRGADLSDTVIVDLSRLRGVSVDPDARSARVLGGSTWDDALAAAAPHGLTALHGSAGDVSVVGYALNGGVSFYARAHGLAVGSVTEAQVVTADGALVRAAADENPDLFWALRGGAGAIGIVVSVRLSLLPYADVFAGMLLWDATRTAEVAHAWARWTATAPESATTALRVLHLPPLPELPPFLSGRSVVVIDGAILETDAAASALLDPLRALAPEIDTFARIPAPALIGVHMDPPEPTPSVSAATMLADLPGEAVDAFVAASGTPGIFIMELRHLGGAAARPADGGGAVSAVAGEYVAHAIAVAPVPEAVPGAEDAVRAGMAQLEPWRSTGVALTFVDEPGTDRAPAFGDGLVRLRELKRAFDPKGMLLGAHPI